MLKELRERFAKKATTAATPKRGKPSSAALQTVADEGPAATDDELAGIIAAGPQSDPKSKLPSTTASPHPTFADLRAAREALAELRKCDPVTAKYNWGVLIKHTGLWQIQSKGTEPKAIMSIVLTRADAVFRIAFAQLALREECGYEFGIGAKNRDTADLLKTAKVFESIATKLAPGFTIDPDLPTKPAASGRDSDFDLDPMVEAASSDK